jgi:hypothetical protein
LGDIHEIKPTPGEGASPARGARIRRWLRPSAPALFAGAALALTAAELLDPGRYSRVLLVVGGALYGLVLRILLRAFPVSPRARPLAGLAVGALPFALSFARALPRDERLGIGVALALLGALIGALEGESRGRA